LTYLSQFDRPEVRRKRALVIIAIQELLVQPVTLFFMGANIVFKLRNGPGSTLQEELRLDE